MPITWRNVGSNLAAANQLLNASTRGVGESLGDFGRTLAKFGEHRSKQATDDYMGQVAGATDQDSLRAIRAGLKDAPRNVDNAAILRSLDTRSKFLSDREAITYNIGRRGFKEQLDQVGLEQKQAAIKASEAGVRSSDASTSATGARQLLNEAEFVEKYTPEGRKRAAEAARVANIFKTDELIRRDAADPSKRSKGISKGQAAIDKQMDRITESDFLGGGQLEAAKFVSKLQAEKTLTNYEIADIVAQSIDNSYPFNWDNSWNNSRAIQTAADRARANSIQNNKPK